jgi:hypothetical protein
MFNWSSSQPAETCRARPRLKQLRLRTFLPLAHRPKGSSDGLAVEGRLYCRTAVRRPYPVFRATPWRRSARGSGTPAARLTFPGENHHRAGHTGRSRCGGRLNWAAPGAGSRYGDGVRTAPCGVGFTARSPDRGGGGRADRRIGLGRPGQLEDRSRTSPWLWTWQVS